MFEIYKDEIQRLINNIDNLKQNLNQNKIELELVKEQNTKLETILKEKELVTEDIKDKYQNLLNARELSGGIESSGNAKTKINTLVREIDKCLALLND